MAVTLVGTPLVQAWARALASTSFDISSLSMQEGDLLVLVVGSSVTQSNRQIYPDQGIWTRVHPTLYRDDTNDINLSTWMMAVGPTPPSSIAMFSTDPTTSATGSTTVTVLVLRGVDLANPLDVTPTTADGINSAHVDPAAITPVTPGALVLVAGVVGHIASQAACDFVLSSGGTQLASIQGFAGQTQQAFTEVASYGEWSSGTLDPGAWTFQVSGVTTNATQSSWGSATMAFRPDAAVEEPDPATGTASGELPLSGTGTGTVADPPPDPATGTGQGTLPLDGSGTGVAPAQGSAQGALPFDGGAQGQVPIQGGGSGGLPLGGSGSGETPIAGTGTGELPLSGSGEGVQGQATSGSGQGELPLSGSGTGETPIRGGAQGELDLDGSGTGALPSSGSASGSLDPDGQGSGSAPVQGGASGDLPLDGTAEGSVVNGGHSGGASGDLPLGGSGWGRAPILGAGDGFLTVVGGGRVAFPHPEQADPTAFPYRRVTGLWQDRGRNRDVPFPRLYRSVPLPRLYRQVSLGHADALYRETL